MEMAIKVTMIIFPKINFIQIKIRFMKNMHNNNKTIINNKNNKTL